MATELPHADPPPPDDEREPRYTGPQPLRQESTRSVRPSSRPSAFGPPRAASSPPPAPGTHDARTSDGPPQTSELRLKRAPVARGNEDEDEDEDGEATRPTLPRVPPRIRPSIPTDIEQLLPISQAVKSLPRPPRMPLHETAVETTPRRMPWASIGVFACALLASAGSLVHYTRLGPVAHVPGPLPGVHTAAAGGARAHADDSAAGAAHGPSLRRLPGHRLAPAAREALRSHAGAAWTPNGRAREPLLAEADHALAVGDHALAGELYRALHPVRPAAAALGLAQIARQRGDRALADRWARRALAARPRDPRAHRLHAELLEERGQSGEARLERALARALESAARHAR